MYIIFQILSFDGVLFLICFSQLLTRHKLFVKRCIQDLQLEVSLLCAQKTADAELIEEKRALIEQYEAVIDQLDTSIDALDNENQQHPFKVFGAPADSSQLASAVSIVTSYYGALFTLLAADSNVAASVTAL